MYGGRFLLFGLAVAISMANASAFQGGEGVPAEMKKLQGIWQVVKFTDHSGQPAPPDELKGFTFEFKGDAVTQRKGKGRRARPGKYTVDSSKKPKWIDLDFGQVSKGIYKLERDELGLCVVAGMRGGKVAPRPTEFKASKDPPYSYLVLKRVKK